MADVIDFRGRQAPPPPPQRSSRIIPVGVRWPGRIGTMHREVLLPAGIDWVQPIEYIAVGHSAALSYRGLSYPAEGQFTPSNDL